jgi:perosamine synthetase
MNIPIAKTVFSDEEYAAVLEPLKSGWVVQGPKVKEFETQWSEFTGAKHSIAVTSCTTALHLSLAGLGIGPEDEVIIPAFTWIATANVVEQLGARVVFCDIDLQTFNLDTTQLENLITKKTKAIIPVHLFGLAADMKVVMELAKKYELAVVEDAACGFGAKYDHAHVGTIGDTGCFSFHPRKAITTGEGGMVTTNDDALAVKLRTLRDHGAAMSDLQRHLGAKPYLLPEFPYAGYNYRMTDIQAAIGIPQMKRADQILASRRRIATKYDELVAEIPWLQAPARPVKTEHAFQAYVCLFMADDLNLKTIDSINTERNSFMEYLQKLSISTRPGTHAVHNLRYYKEKYCIETADYPNAWMADQCTIALPLFPSLVDDEFEYITDALKNYHPGKIEQD